MSDNYIWWHCSRHKNLDDLAYWLIASLDGNKRVTRVQTNTKKKLYFKYVSVDNEIKIKPEMSATLKKKKKKTEWMGCRIKNKIK